MAIEPALTVAHDAPSLSPRRRAWLRFRANRRGAISLWIFAVMFGVSLIAEVVSNDKPLVARYEGQWYFPLLHVYPETTFGGDFRTATDYLDPFIREQLAEGDNWALTALGVVVGVTAGAVQGYFGGRVDLAFQRFIEVWSSVPELYLLLILASLFEPSIWVLLAILATFGWMGLSDYVRAEFLRNRTLDYVTSARALGLADWQIIWRHVLPNSLTPVVAFLPFRMSASIVALTSLDFLGLGVPSSTPSLGEVLAQGKSNLDAWWIAMPAFALLVVTLLLLVFIGEALRDALDTRRG